MRSFRTPDGQVLVEWSLSETDVVKPDRTPLGQGGSFYLLDAARTVLRSWSTSSSAVQEHLSTSAYVIEDDALVRYFHDVAWGHEDRPSLSRSVELDGLRLLAPAEAPSEAAVRKAIDRDEASRRGTRAEYELRESERLAGFEQALPDLDPGEAITLVWRYAGEDIVIARSTGEELWREPDWPWMGKDLHRRLSRVAATKYGERLEAFEVDVPAEEYLRFDND
jgi:hypothetical protein